MGIDSCDVIKQAAGIDSCDVIKQAAAGIDSCDVIKLAAGIVSGDVIKAADGLLSTRCLRLRSTVTRLTMDRLAG